MTSPKVLVLQGPNLDRLGARQTEIYGHCTLDSLRRRLDTLARSMGLSLEHVQSAHEGVLVDAIHHAADGGVCAAIVNAAAFTHTSIALRDALLAVPFPFVEVHISQTAAREAFRQTSLLSDIAKGTISGLGVAGYALALRVIATDVCDDVDAIWAGPTPLG